jgi:chaperonin GroEL
MLIQNTTHGTLQAVAVRAFGHRRLAYLQDLAVFTGGQVITDETGLSLQSVERSVFGTARRVVVTEIKRATHERDARSRTSASPSSAADSL